MKPIPLLSFVGLFVFLLANSAVVFEPNAINGGADCTHPWRKVDCPDEPGPTSFCDDNRIDKADGNGNWKAHFVTFQAGKNCIEYTYTPPGGPNQVCPGAAGDQAETNCVEVVVN